MDQDQKIKLETLLKNNNKRLEDLKIKNNILLNEAIEALDGQALVLDKNQSKFIYNKFIEVTPFTESGIDSNKLKNYSYITNLDDLKINMTTFFYIIWGDKLPIIKSNLENILNNIDDVLAVEADTWLISDEFNTVIEFYHEGLVSIGNI